MNQSSSTRIFQGDTPGPIRSNGAGPPSWFVCIAVAGLLILNAAPRPAQSKRDVPPSNENERPLLPPYPTLQNAATAAGKVREHVIVLSELMGNHNIELHGVNPSSTLYIPVPEEWLVKGGQLELHFTHSSTLLADSTMTVKVNDIPAASLRLTEGNTEGSWRIKLPRSTFEASILKLTFMAYLRTTSDPCHDMEDQGAWVNVQKESTLHLVADRTPFRPNLARFPYPFYRLRSLENPVALVVLPDSAKAEDWGAILPLAAYMGQLASWREFRVYAILERDMTDAVAANYDLIFSGPPESFQWVRSHASQLPLLPAAAGGFKDRSGATIPAESGVIMEIQSPWNPEKGVMFITGSDKEAIQRAVAALTRPEFAQVARGNYAIVSGIELSTNASPVRTWNQRTFKQLGYENQILRGLGKQTADITFELPANQRVQSAGLTVNMSHSPFVTTDRSYFNVLLNDLPVKGAYLTSANERPTLWEVSLPVGQLQTGRNTLRLQFEFHLTDHEDCDDTAWEQAWGVVHQDSRLNIQFSRQLEAGDLANFPSPFDQPTTLVLPESPGPNELAASYLIMTQMGREMGEAAKSVSVVTAGAFDREASKNSHLILIGRQESNPVLKEFASALPYIFNGPVKSVKTLPATLQVEGDEEVGVLQLFVSPFSDSKTALAITGTKDENVGWAALMLIDPAQRQQLKGNVAVIDSTGTLTTIDTRTPAPPPKGVLPGTQPTPRWASQFGLLVILMLLIPVGYVLARRMWTGRRPRP